MAAIVYFRKVAEESSEIRYLFGFDPKGVNRTLVMNVDSERSLPEDGEIDYEFMKTSRKINSMHAETGIWPERGSSVS